MQINTQTLGIIESFDPVTQFAKVRLICNDFDGPSGQNYLTTNDIILVEVPVEFPRCGDFCITFPIKGGEDCIVTFMEQGISHWQYEDRRAYLVEDGRPEPASQRKYDRSDAVCRVVVGNLAHGIPAFSVENFEVRNMEGNQRLTFFPDGNILLTTPSNINLDAGGNISINAGGNISCTASGAFKAKGASASLEASGAATVKGGSVALTGGSVSVSKG